LSLCSGIEAASVAWAPLGWAAAGFAEVDPFRCELLAQRYPAVPNLGDLTAITDDDVRQLGRIDVVVGGTPCQDLSVAGKRAGIDGERSRLFFDFVRVFDAARTFCGARWALWENTPGALWNNAGRDFARVVAEFVGLDELEPPGDGWGNEGLAVGPRGLAEWCVLDAQWFGVAQRRERVFVVVDAGNWADRRPVLLEPEGLRGDSPPSRETGAAIAGTLRPSAFDGSSACGGDGRDGLLIAEVAEPLTAHNARNATHAGNNARPRNVVIHSIAGQGVAVRRLTPIECERLQGFPDGYTGIRRTTGKPASDTQRYAALGDSIATPVLAWIGRQLDAACNRR
jgi:DNA (cytosine-5)-methyltransferase 1